MMRENLLNKKDNNTQIAEKYLKKYLSDLQKHLNLSEKQIIKILGNITTRKKITTKKNYLNKIIINIEKLFHKSNNMLL